MPCMDPFLTSCGGDIKAGTMAQDLPLKEQLQDVEAEGSSVRMRQQSSGRIGGGKEGSRLKSSKLLGTRDDIDEKSVGYYRNVKLLQQALASFSLGLIGWYYPRYLIEHEDGIQHREVPYQKTSAGDVILDFMLNDPLVYPPTISSSFLTYTSVFVPIFVVLVVGYFFASPNVSTLNEAHSSFCGFSMAIGLSEGTTQLLKLLVQRRRPNFYSLCRFDEKLLECTAPLKRLREANFSFPSGHSSLTCCGMTFLVWYLLGKVELWHLSISSSPLQTQAQQQQPQYDRQQLYKLGRRRFWLSLLSCILPWGWTVLVATTRLLDHWHHPSDVLAGLALGFITCTIAYHHWFPSIFSSNPGVPWSVVYGSVEASPNKEFLKLPSFNE